MNKYAVIKSEDLKGPMPQCDIVWRFTVNGTEYTGLEFGKGETIPNLTGWTVLTGKEEFEIWEKSQ